MPTIRPLRLLPVSIGLTLYQLTLALFMIGGKPARLVFWDATWYRDIASFGYQVSFPLPHAAEGGSNISFFPAFPLWAHAWLQLPHISPNLGVLLASWTACAAMWAYLALLLRQLGVGAGWGWAALLGFLVQPGAFYSVAGYSEPLFVAALLGFVYWSNRALESSKPSAWVLAALHGAVMTSTRVLGVALAAYPLLLALAHLTATYSKGKRGSRLGLAQIRRLAAPTLLGVASLSGFVAFLAYCAIRWGHWDLYWEANRIGWNVYFDPWKLLKPSYYMDVFFVGNLPELIGRMLTIATLAAAIGLGRWAWKERSRQAMPLALAALSLGLLFETIVGSHGMHSMIRYLMPIHALVLPLAAAWAQKQERPWPSVGWRVTGGLLAIWLLSIQILFIIRYSHGEWVS